MKRKYESCTFAPWDARGMAAHLEAMEAKGWRFRGTDRLGRWGYEPCTPRSVRYAVAFAPSRRNWRITPTEPERDLEAICFDAGWRKVEALSRFHIYRNEDPDATELETDELTRLDTLDRALGRPMVVSALVRSISAVLMLGVLLWALADDLPRALAMPALPGGLVFLLWLMLSELVRLGLFRRWRSAAGNAAQAGLPCPEVKGWRQFSRWSSIAAALSLPWIFARGNLILILGYAAVLLFISIVHWWLVNRMHDEVKAEKLFQAALVVAFVLLFAINRIDTHLSSDPAVESIPLSAQDLVDTSGMDLRQFDLNGTDAPWASNHDYWQPDNRSSFDLRYTVFDLRLPFLEEVCRDWFRADFEAIAARTDSTPEPAAPAPWGAEEARRAGQRWLLIYGDRIVYLSTSWELTPEQIAAAAAKLAP